MQRDDSSPDAYRAAVSGEQSDLLERIRKQILSVAPDVEETTKYGMLNYPGLGSLAAQKHYVSLYVSPDVISRHAKDFDGVDHGKSCLRFRRIAQLDDRALARLIAAAYASGNEC